MRSYTAAEQAYLQNRAAGKVVKGLIWFSARNRGTNAIETIGLWTGDDDQSFVIEGETRVYFGAGQIIGIDPIGMSVGLVVRSQRIRLVSFSAQVRQMIQEYDVGLAEVEIHRALFHADTRALVAAPHRIWKGFVDKAPLPTAPIDGDEPAEITLVSAARALTKGLTLTNSDSVQRQRGGDRFLKYATIAGVVRSPWGASMPQEPQPTPRPPSGGRDR